MELDPRIQAGIIAFVAAILATAINNYFGFRLARIKGEEDKKLSNFQNLRTQREKALRNLYLLSTMLSFSKVDMANGREDVKDFNKNYDAANELIAELMMSFSLYFREYKEDFKPLPGEAGSYWKYYKDHLISENKDYGSPASNFQKSLNASRTCNDIIHKLVADLGSTKNA
ncbi:MAG: hypothetical protein PF483_11545 [Halothiobacillus sp.]|jgi:hypothetical protein|nr:hypothetical protein [Halothiobacillus sp.]